MELRTKSVWMDGTLVDWDKAHVHVLTHALHYGTGAFEGIRFYDTPHGTAIFRLRDHIARLERSFAWILPLPYTIDEICEASREVVRINGLKEGYLRPLAFVGMERMGMDLRGMPVHVALAVWPWGIYLGEEALRNGVKCKTSIFERPRTRAYPGQAKLSGKYVNSVMGKLDAVGKGYGEAIMLDSAGNVSEGPGENIFIVKDDVITSPGAEADALEGITRDSVLTIARDLGYRVKDQVVTREMLFSADEAFFTGTAAEVTPIASVDDRKIGSGVRGPVTERLQATFFNTVHGKDERYMHWLDIV